MFVYTVCTFLYLCVCLKSSERTEIKNRGVRKRVRPPNGLSVSNLLMLQMSRENSVQQIEKETVYKHSSCMYSVQQMDADISA